MTETKYFCDRCGRERPERVYEEFARIPDGWEKHMRAWAPNLDGHHCAECLISFDKVWVAWKNAEASDD